MPSLDWIGRQAVLDHHNQIPYRLLRCERVAGDSHLEGDGVRCEHSRLADNLLVEGDNLEALKALLPYYAGQVKCIYIDPPYNTGNENWVYNDAVNSPQMQAWLHKTVDRDDLSRHDKWLCMMYPRLSLLHKLLRDDGSLWMSIDDNEVHHARALLDVVEEMRLLQPSSSIQVSKKNPDRFVKRAAKIIRTGFGQPSVFNADLIVQELVRMGKSVVDARCGGSSGGVEVGAFGKEAYLLTGYFNLPKILELTLHGGVDPRTGQPLGLQTGDPRQFRSLDELFVAFEKQVRHFVDIKIRGNQVIERLYAAHMPAPFLSLLIDDCIAKGQDYHDGGARYNTSYIQGVGVGSLTDSLTALKYHVFDQQTMTMDKILSILEADFEGCERQRQLLLNKTPKYGNDDDYADEVMKAVFEVYFRAIDGRKNTRRGEYRINLLPTTVHVYFGSVTGATADGRRRGQPLSEGISPVQGADRHGPTAVIRSVAKMDHARTGGTLLNQKFTPQLLKDDDGLDKLVQLIRTYFKLDGHHLQFNVVDAATLRAAQQNPEQYRDLIVRVASYSDYFCDLSQALQDEIIARTEHQDF